MAPPDGVTWGGYSARLSFNRLLSEAIADLASTGYVSPDRIEEWIVRLRNAAERELGADHLIEQEMRAKLGSIYQRYVDSPRLVKTVPGVTRFNISIVKPKLRAELDRRIWASADLIKLHKRDAVDRTLQRLSGWATSIPEGGDDTVDKREVKADVGKSVAQFKYEKRRVDIDQSAKLLANVSNIVAVDAGAIAGMWHSHGEHDRSYNARKDHLDRVGKIYLLRDSWADKQGLIEAVDGYYDEVTAAAQEPFCRCFLQYVTSLRRLPEAMLTEKGRAWIERGRIQAERMSA